MSRLPAPVRLSGTLVSPEDDAEAARRFASRARAENTLRGYRSDWADFAAWCDDRGASALPATPATVALYVASRATAGPDGAPALKVSTLERRLAAVSQAHKLAGYASPASRQSEPLHSVWRGLVRERGTAPGKVAPALTPDVVAMVEAIVTADVDGSTTGHADVLRGKRDRALILLGFAAALRRSELAAVRTEHVGVSPDGARLSIPRSKTDQEGAGHVVGVAYGARAATCPVRALQSWMLAASRAPGPAGQPPSPLSGPVFRAVGRPGTLGRAALSDKTVARVVKARAAAAGLDPDLYSGHSLRAGFATQAARSGKADRSIMRQTRHKSLAVLNEYVREGRLFDDNASDGLGL